MIRRLPIFRGYTVDARLGEFRKVPTDALPEFISFDSPQDRALLIAYIATKTDETNLWDGDIVKE